MLDETFAESIVHRRAPWGARVCGLSGYVVLGRRLRPFSRWHNALLDALQSPFLGHDRPFDFPALLIAVEVCSLRYPQRPDERLAPRWWSYARRLFTMRRYLRRFFRELSVFSSYTASYSSSPLQVVGENSSAVKTPWYLYEVAALCARDPKLSRAQAWDLPLGESRWWLTAALEAAGEKIDILTSQDRADFKRMGVEI